MLPAAMLSAAWIACSGGDSSPPRGSFPGGDAGDASTRTDGAAGDGGLIQPGDSGTGDAMECAGEVVEAVPIPVDLVLMLDRSGSMLFPTDSGQTKWDVLTSSLTSFLADARSEDLGLGVALFPQNVPGVPNECTDSSDCGMQGPCVLRVCQETGVRPCTDDGDCSMGVPCIDFGWCANNNAFGCFPIGGNACMSTGGPGGDCVARSNSFCRLAESCDVTQYATPAIEVAPVPNIRSDVMLTIATERPAGISSTPTWAALQGAHTYARSHSDANPGRTVAVVLATDGLPSGRCNPKDIPTISDVAAAALASSPGIRTFVVGVFADSDTDAQTNLDSIASAGGTDRAFITGTGTDVADRLSDALSSIRESTFSCDQQLPEPPAGMTLDLTRVNVEFVSGAGRSVVPFVEASDRCDPMLGGWHYGDDGSGNPERIVLCPATCDSVNQQPQGQLEIRVGCATIIR